jgi:hypothetical protein
MCGRHGTDISGLSWIPSAIGDLVSWITGAPLQGDLGARAQNRLYK